MKSKKEQAHDLMNDARRNMTESKLEDAIACIDKATILYEEIYHEDKETLSAYYLRFADILNLKLSAYEKAIEYYEKANKLLDDDEKIAYNYYVMSEIYDADLDKLTDAADMLNKAIEIYIKDKKYSNMLAKSLENIANIYFRLNDVDMATKAICQAMEIVKTTDSSSSHLAFTSQSAGKLLFEMRMYDKAIEYLDMASKLYSELGDDDAANDCLYELKIVKAYANSDLH